MVLEYFYEVLVGIARLSDYKIRRHILAGKTDDLVRAGYKLLEFAMFRMREASRLTGKNFTAGIGIADVNGFNLKEYACPSCKKPILLHHLHDIIPKNSQRL